MTGMILFRTSNRQPHQGGARPHDAIASSAEKGRRSAHRYLALCVGVFIIGAGNVAFGGQSAGQEVLVFDIGVVALGSEFPLGDVDQAPNCIAWSLAGLVLRACLSWRKEGVEVMGCLGQGDSQRCWSTDIGSTGTSWPYSGLETPDWSPERYLPCSDLLLL